MIRPPLETIASSILLITIREGSQRKWIVVEFDTYQENSIKNREQSTRGEESGEPVTKHYKCTDCEEVEDILVKNRQQNKLDYFLGQ